jgi:hypothetical protein
MTICIQCAMEAFARGATPDAMRLACSFEETPEQHQARCHPDLAETKRRRHQLEALAAQRMGGAMYYPEPTDNN